MSSGELHFVIISSASSAGLLWSDKLPYVSVHQKLSKQFDILEKAIRFYLGHSLLAPQEIVGHEEAAK